jgi:hypothetical protein
MDRTVFESSLRTLASFVLVPCVCCRSAVELATWFTGELIAANVLLCLENAYGAFLCWCFGAAISLPLASKSKSLLHCCRGWWTCITMRELLFHSLPRVQRSKANRSLPRHDTHVKLEDSTKKKAPTDSVSLEAAPQVDSKLKNKPDSNSGLHGRVSHASHTSHVERKETWKHTRPRSSRENRTLDSQSTAEQQTQGFLTFRPFQTEKTWKRKSTRAQGRAAGRTSAGRQGNGPTQRGNTKRQTAKRRANTHAQRHENKASADVCCPWSMTTETSKHSSVQTLASNNRTSNMDTVGNHLLPFRASHRQRDTCTRQVCLPRHNKRLPGYPIRGNRVHTHSHTRT